MSVHIYTPNLEEVEKNIKDNLIFDIWRKYSSPLNTLTKMNTEQLEMLAEDMLLSKLDC